ncbi:MAG: DUF4013 domain-containing protein [Anaerolineales bacterium]|nr:DUF4013 domain-containing protein [Anaerolineales bacterium]
MATSFTSEKILKVVRFPFEDKKWIEKLFILCSMVVGSILIIPTFFLLGYNYEIQRRMIVEGEEPTLPEWEDWGTLFKNGIKIFTVRFLYSIPYYVIIFPAMAVTGTLLIVNPDFLNNPIVFLIVMPVILIFFSAASFFGLFTSLFAMAGQGHMIAHGEFKAAFRLREVWCVFRSNIGGYLLTYLFLYAISYFAISVIQILGMTIILILVIPFLMILFSAFYSLVSTVLFTQMYIDGAARVGT